MISIDGVRNNNRWNNLRQCTRAENLWNAKRRTVAKSGLKGAHWNPARQNWRSSISTNGVETRLGSFDTAEEAHEAYCRAAAIQHGEFARIS